MEVGDYVTVAEFLEFVKATGYDYPQSLIDWQCNVPTWAIVHINFNDAVAYCKWAGGRLLTEQEWETEVMPKKMCSMWEMLDNNVLRGGSWYLNPRNVRASYRSRLDPEDRYDSIGFRCVKG